MWVCVCVGVLVICVLVFAVFCIVCTVSFVLFRLCMFIDILILILIYLSTSVRLAPGGSTHLHINST
jgi:hypothetical protein